MRWKTGLACVVFAAAAMSLAAQASTTTQTTTTKTTTTSGEVVQYEPGKTIVIRYPQSRTVTYTLDGGLTVPADVQVGRKVTIYSSPIDGSIRVQKITTMQTTMSDGNTSTSTETRDEPSSPSAMQSAPPQSAPPTDDGSGQTTTTTTTKTTRISGTVRAFQPGQSITIVGPGRKTTTYTITTDSQLPPDVAVGKQVTVETAVVSGKPVARTVTYKTTTKTTQTKSQ